MDKNDRLVTLIRLNDEMHAAMIVSTLEQNGIKATATGGFTAGFRAEAPGYVDVMISEKDHTEAKRILDTISADDPKIDWSRVDVGSPQDLDG